MPLHLTPMNRRSFLKQTVAAAAGLSCLKLGYAAPESDRFTLALLSDTHIAADPETIARGINMTANLNQVVQEVLQLPTKPQAVIVNGDCAYNRGQPGDYVQFAKCLQPLVESGHSLHMTMGNHDDRGPFYDALQAQKPAQPLLDSRHVSILETPYANLFLLDTLTITNVVTGEVGAAQLKWLGEVLDSHADKPAILMAHHPLQLVPPAEGKPWSGIADSADFLALMESRPHVKTFVFGHTHVTSQSQQGKIQLINLPAVAYVFSPKEMSGWTLATLHPRGIDFQLQSLNPDLPQHHRTYKVEW